MTTYKVITSPKAKKAFEEAGRLQREKALARHAKVMAKRRLNTRLWKKEKAMKAAGTVMRKVAVPIAVAGHGYQTAKKLNQLRKDIKSTKQEFGKLKEAKDKEALLSARLKAKRRLVKK